MEIVDPIRICHINSEICYTYQRKCIGMDCETYLNNELKNKALERY